MSNSNAAAEAAADAAELLARTLARQTPRPQPGILAFGRHLPAPGLQIWADEPFFSPGRRADAAEITQIVLHETAGGDPDVVEEEGEGDDRTERTLRGKRLGVHFVIGFDRQGRALIAQHGDLAQIYYHTGRPVNAASVGLELINPYTAPRGAWTRTIPAPWAWRGRYVLPLLCQCEAAYRLVLALEPITGTLAPWGVEGGRFRMGAKPQKWSRGTPGLLAHHHYGRHADGAFPALYCELRRRGLEPLDAYERAVGIAEGAKIFVELDYHTKEGDPAPAAEESGAEQGAEVEA